MTVVEDPSVELGTGPSHPARSEMLSVKENPGLAFYLREPKENREVNDRKI